MNRHESFKKIWLRLILILLSLVSIAIIVSFVGRDISAPTLVLLFGNIGAYVGIHRQLEKLNDEELRNLADSWLGLIVPSFIGGILSFILYILFLSKIVSGDLFPEFVIDTNAPPDESFKMLSYQHAKDVSDYAKLLFWSFVAGFNQKFVVDIIESMRSKI